MKAEPNPDALAPPPARTGSAFPSTQWSVVLRAGADTETSAQAALETLCRHYWYPLYSFIRRQGRAHHEAEDCTQEFLARLLSHSGFAQARPERGRFRTFLLTALRHFLTNEWHRTQAAKRGGGQSVLSLDFERADARFALEPVDPGLTPEQAFDHGWALALLDEASQALRADYRKTGRGELFAALEPFLWGDPAVGALSAQASRLGLTADAFSVGLHRLRQRFGDRLRANVAETVADAAELDAELRYLIGAVGGSSRAA